MWLRDARSASGLTMREVGDRLDWSLSTVQKIEKGLHRIDALQLVRYCEVLGVDVHEAVELLRGDG